MPRHEVDHRSLIAGLLFSALGVLFMIDQATDVRIDLQWVWPLFLIGLGVAGLASTTLRRRSGQQIGKD
ncbi:MAG TPA: hypothetical protein VFA83_10490 [Acidimicrobiales bacterium]|nr:hypothetical protein [Acidimicrobiales bacterium]